MNAYIALGSNLNQPEQQIKQAISTIREHSDLKIVKLSSLYQSKAVTLAGSSSQADYINAVLLLETTLSAQDLLEVLQQIEIQQGRIRTEKWSTRTLDLDILLYGDNIIATKTLIIPHPYMAQRNFVLYPLAEISPQLNIPGKGSLDKLLDGITWNGLKKIV